MNKCSFSDGSIVSVGGVPVDPCVYEEVETVTGCTVRVLKCKKCGNIEIEWERGEDNGSEDRPE